MSDNYSFDLEDFIGDLEADKVANPEHHTPREFGPREEWPIPLAQVVNGVTVGKGSITLSPKNEDFKGNRTHEIALNIPLTAEFNGVKCTSFFRYSTRTAIGLRLMMEFMSAFGTTDPALALTRSRGAVINGYFKGKANGDFKNYDISNFKVVEAPNMSAETADPTIKVTDRRDGAAASKPKAATPAVPAVPTPGAAAPVVPTPNVDGNGEVQNFWEKEA